MKSILSCFVFCFALQASDCATAGSIQDSQVTKEKRAADAQTLGSPTPTPVVMRDVHTGSFPAADYMATEPKRKPPCLQLPQRPRQAPEVAER